MQSTLNFLPKGSRPQSEPDLVTLGSQTVVQAERDGSALRFASTLPLKTYTERSTTAQHDRGSSSGGVESQINDSVECNGQTSRSDSGALVSAGTSETLLEKVAEDETWLPSSEAPALSGSVGIRLTYRLLNDNLRCTIDGVDINTQPYALLSGRANLFWRNHSHAVSLNDEVRAARGEGACGLLCILDVLRAANLDHSFRKRVREHAELQGIFQDKWNVLLAMTEDRGAEGLRVLIYCHATGHKERFGILFPPGERLTEADARLLLQFEKQNNLLFDEDEPPCAVRRAAYRFLSLSDHLTESFLKVFLDWLEHKVALLPLIQNEGDNLSQFLHVPALNFITDAAVLFLKILPVIIERQTGVRANLNHFDRVRGQQPMSFLEDLPLADESSSSYLPSSSFSPEERADLLSRSRQSYFTGSAVVPADRWKDLQSSVDVQSSTWGRNLKSVWTAFSILWTHTKQRLIVLIVLRWFVEHMRNSLAD